MGACVPAGGYMRTREDLRRPEIEGEIESGSDFHACWVGLGWGKCERWDGLDRMACETPGAL